MRARRRRRRRGRRRGAARGGAARPSPAQSCLPGTRGRSAGGSGHGPLGGFARRAAMDSASAARAGGTRGAGAQGPGPGITAVLSRERFRAGPPAPQSWARGQGSPGRALGRSGDVTAPPRHWPECSRGTAGPGRAAARCARVPRALGSAPGARSCVRPPGPGQGGGGGLVAARRRLGPVGAAGTRGLRFESASCPRLRCSWSAPTLPARPPAAPLVRVLVPVAAGPGQGVLGARTS